MPSGGRRIPRSSRPPLLSAHATIHNPPENFTGSRFSATNSDVPVAPKHIPFPNIPQDGDFEFEVIMFSYSLLVCGLQFLHLYRTVWWLPHSNTNQTMNFYLIDPYLVAFIFLMLGRRLTYLVVFKMVQSMASINLLQILSEPFKLAFLSTFAVALLWCMYNIMQNHPLVNIFYLCYPHLVYIILFHLQITPFLELGGGSDGCYLGGGPIHCCSSNASVIRNEVEVLKTDFNNRMKQVLFGSVINAYYACFVPCCFAQSYLYYDVYWATQHLAFVWVGCFTMYAVQCYPAKYCDVLHRAALHLGILDIVIIAGHWNQIESRLHLPPAFQWNSEVVWPAGALVRYSKELFRAQTLATAAEPGNNSHIRFHAIFQNPSVLLCTLLALQLSLVLLQLAVIFGTTEWHQLLSLAMLLFSNYYMLYKLARDYLVTWKVYKAECVIQDKLLSAQQN